MWRTVCATSAILIAGAFLLWSSTDGLRAFTAEGARRLAVADAPRDVPVVRLSGMDGQSFSFPSGRDEIVLVEFIYTRCPTICRALGESFAQIADAKRRGLIKRPVRLYSISFDIDNDDMAALQGYGALHGADGVLWDVAAPGNRQELEGLLRTFGVTVIPDDFGGFEHNAAVHLIDRKGRLAAIMDHDPIEPIVDQIRRMP